MYTFWFVFSHITVPIGKPTGKEITPAYCAGIPDRNYYHPDDCTKFIACSGEKAYEMVCAACDTDMADACVRGRLVFSLYYGEYGLGNCVWADEADCREPEALGIGNKD